MSMRRGVVIAMVLLLAVSAAAKREETFEQLRARADAANPKDRDKLFAEVSRRAVDLANGFYNAGDLEKAKAAVDIAVDYAQKARDAARDTGKNIKRTEITLRETARRLDDIGKSLSFEDRPYVEDAVRRIEAARTDLLDQMFGPPRKEKR